MEKAFMCIATNSLSISFSLSILHICKDTVMEIRLLARCVMDHQSMEVIPSLIFPQISLKILYGKFLLLLAKKVSAYSL